jgi:hypothetical protein
MHMDTAGWLVAEPVVLQAAAALDQQNMMANGVAPSGWLNATGIQTMPPAMIGQAQIPLPPSMYAGGGYMPRNDFGVTGYYPYQYPVGMPPTMMPGMMRYEDYGTKAAKGAGRGLIGFLKTIPLVGNVLNGIDFIRDIGKGLSTFANPTKTWGEKMKAGADLLFHGAGVLVPQVGAAYDMAQGAMRVGAAAIEGAMGPPWARLPPFNYNMGGYNNVYNMQHLNPMATNPFMFGRFPNYAQYPPYYGGQQFMPQWLTGQQFMPQPYPMLPYGFDPYSSGYPMNRMYDPYMGSPYGMGYGYNPAMYDPKLGTPGDGVKGAVRTGIGALKMTPGLGNIINGIDFIRDIGKVIKSFSDPSVSFMKSASDLLFHGAGMLVPQIGGAYDMAQGTVRMGAAASNPWNRLPPWNFNPGGYRPMYPGFGF